MRAYLLPGMSGVGCVINSWSDARASNQRHDRPRQSYFSNQQPDSSSLSYSWPFLRREKVSSPFRVPVVRPPVFPARATERLKVNYVGESPSSPLLPLSVSPLFPRPPHGMRPRLCCLTISSLFVSRKQRPCS